MAGASLLAALNRVETANASSMDRRQNISLDVDDGHDLSPQPQCEGERSTATGRVFWRVVGVGANVMSPKKPQKKSQVRPCAEHEVSSCDDRRTGSKSHL